MVLGNITNLLADLGDGNVQVELVANGAGVRLLTGETPELAEQIRALAERGVRFVACQNSLNHLGLQRSSLLEGVEIVPAGVSELVKKQAEGWGYIRP